MDYSAILISQYLAALEMLTQVLVQCPEAIWNSPRDQTPVWRLAYHALFYTHLYLQDSEQTFTPWSQHRDEYQFIGSLPWPPHAPPHIGEPYDRESMLAYAAFCRQQVEQQVPLLKLDAASGFAWLPFTKLELQLYNLRHLQQHTGELMERLGERANLEFQWIGTRPNDR